MSQARGRSSGQRHGYDNCITTASGGQIRLPSFGPKPATWALYRMEISRPDFALGLVTQAASRASLVHDGIDDKARFRHPDHRVLSRHRRPVHDSKVQSERGAAMTTCDRCAFDRSKRTVDVLLASFGLVVLAPVMFAIAIGIRLTIGSPIFFRQERVGRYGRRFIILKFRTLDMADARCCGEPQACRGLQTPPDMSVGRFALFLRKSGFDELPQLLAVLRGEMSLIGPRPLLARYVTRYTVEQARRHEVLPGITGWAQVNGRTDLSWEEHLALDVYYVDHRSFALDARIAWRSVAAIWKGVGGAESSAIGPEFLGLADLRDVCPVTLGPVGGPIARGELTEL